MQITKEITADDTEGCACVFGRKEMRRVYRRQPVNLISFIFIKLQRSAFG